MSTIWQPVVVVDGSDVTSLVTAELSVHAEESTARIANFSIKTPSGTITAGDWLGVPVTIDYKTLDSSGATLTQDRIFTGIVDRAFYDPRTQLTSFECTDNLQEDMEAKTKEQVEALVPTGRWSEAVFGEYQDGWQHLQNLLETVPQGYEYDRNGTGVLTDWAAKATPDFSYNQSTIIDGSMQYSLAPRRDLVNQVTIEYDYRFRRFKHREHAYSWSFAASVPGWSFCGTYIQDSHTVPTEDMITEAANSTDWKVQGEPTFQDLPASGWICGDTHVWINWPNLPRLAINASWTAVRRWTQEATEKYTLTVQAPQSITWLGTIAREEFASMQTEASAEGWEDGTDTPTGGRTDSLGDTVIDETDRATSDNDMETLIARARVQILDAHRANWLEAQVKLEPNMELSHTVSLSDGALTGQGKVIGITHSMGIDNGEATTLVRIAVSLNGGATAITDDAIAAPAAPNTDPLSAPPSASTALDTHLGGKTGAPVYDANWNGFTGNYQVVDIGAEIYPRRFSVPAPEINQDAIDAIEGSQAATYEFDVPNETLTITVP